MNSTLRLIGVAAIVLAVGQALAQPVIDGTRDGSYYTQAAVQNTQTGFGDSNLGVIDFANGSELDNVWYYRTATDLYLFIGGNLESNYNKLEIFLDTGISGDNRLLGGYPDVDYGALNRMSDDGNGNGLTFDSTFKATHWYGFTCGGDPLTTYANFSEVKSVLNGGVGYWLGMGSAGNGSITGGNNPNNVEATINNSNVAGVPGGIDIDAGNGQSVTTGMEIKIPLTEIGSPSGIIKASIIINGSGHDYLSNQVLGGIGGGDNLGDPRYNDFSFVPGDQFITIPAGSTTETLAPNGNTINLGKVSGGDLSSLAADDGNALTVCKFIVPSQTSPIVRMTQTYTTTKPSPTAVELDVKAKLVNAGAFKIRGFQHNYSSSSDDQVIADTTLTLSYATYTGSASGTLTNYVGASNAMQTKVEIQQTGPSTVTAPCVSFEFINLKVTG